MEKGKIICYTLKPTELTRREIDRFQGELNGRDIRSNYGKYTYHREGLLDRIPHIKPVRSVIVVLPEFSGEILDLLRRYRAEIFARDIILERQDIRKLKGIRR
jgi:hypothetical protein